MAILIGNVTDLQKIGNDPSYPIDGDYELSGDIDASATSGWNGGDGFDPIVDFSGTFDGKNYSITSLFIDRSSTSNIGLFAVLYGSLSDINLVSCDITGDVFVGALVGSSDAAASITGCASSGLVSGFASIGGLIGHNLCSVSNSSSSCTISAIINSGGFIGELNSGNITNCHASGDVTVSFATCGGFVSYGDTAAIISNCYATGIVTGEFSGGFIGENFATINNCYATGNVIGFTFDAGGFFSNSTGTITNCYATGDVTCLGWEAGGFGGAAWECTIENCYSTGSVDGSGLIGGFLGHVDGECNIRDCYSTGNVSDISGGSGGFCADMYGNTIIVERCYASGDVTSDGGSGGFAAALRGVTINSCAYSGTVHCDGEAGGFTTSLINGSINKSFVIGTVISDNSTAAGFIVASEDEISDCYSTADVFSSTVDVGKGAAGFVFDNHNVGSSVENCYSSGAVNGGGGGVVGGFCGINAGTIMDCFWDTVTSGQPTSDGGTGKITSEMYHEITFTGWDFDGIWNIAEGVSYPKLSASLILLYSISDIQKIGINPFYALDASYELMQDINASDTSSWNGGAGFIPIGDLSNKFSGSFDGKGHTISNLFINRPSADDVALFGFIDDATISNVNMTGCRITGNDRVGALIGESSGAAAVFNCATESTIIGTNDVGGLVGKADGGISITNCSASADVRATIINGGGFVGTIFDASINKCYAEGNVDYGSNLGGFCGSIMDAAAVIQNCYAHGNVNGDFRIGGFVGYDGSSGLVSYCYSIGLVTGNTNDGGFLGELTSTTFTSCYWDTNTSGVGTSAAGTGKTTTQMKLEATFSGWTFGGLPWTILETYTYPLFVLPAEVSWDHVETNRPATDLTTPYINECTFDSTAPMSLLPDPFDAADFQETDFIYDTFGFTNTGSGE